MLVVHHTSLGEMTSKLTTRPLQRISLVGSNREGWIGNHGAGLVGVKTRSTDETTQHEGHRSLPPLPRRYVTPNQKDLIITPSLSHSSLVVALLSQVVTL